MKSDTQFVAAILSITALLSVIAAVGVLMFYNVPPDNKDLVNIGIMALVGYTGTAFGFYLGSSMGSARKNEIMAGTIEAPEDKE